VDGLSKLFREDGRWKFGASVLQEARKLLLFGGER